jgi:hypothetical protein
MVEVPDGLANVNEVFWRRLDNHNVGLHSGMLERQLAVQILA